MFCPLPVAFKCTLCVAAVLATVLAIESNTPEGRSLDRESVGLELYVLIDRSSSIDPVQLEDAKNFVKFLLQSFAINNGNDEENGTRASVTTFGTEVQVVFELDDKNISNYTLAAVAVDSIQPNGGGTNLQGAFVRVMLDFHLMRPQAKRVLFLMTDGESNIGIPDVTLQDMTQYLTEQLTCSPYPHVFLEHGTIRRVSPTKFTFHCDNGYYLATHEMVRCFRGNWTSDRAPKCIEKPGQCDEPPAVPHAVIHGDERHEGATVMYLCEQGFTLLGHSRLHCTRTLHWNRRPPTCMEESEPLENVAERLKDSFVTSIANYSADTPEGRSLDKESVRLGLELFIVIDRSSSVDPVQLEDAKEFVKFLLRRFAVRNGKHNKNGTRAAVITFGTEVQRVFSLTDKNISNPTLAAAAIDGIQPNGGGTNLAAALVHVITDAGEDNLLRPDAKRAMFLMSDGEPNIHAQGATHQEFAEMLRNAFDFEIFAVGIGKGINMHFLGQLASEPPLNHVFMLEKYASLNDVMKLIRNPKTTRRRISKEQCGYNATGEDRPWIATLYVEANPLKVCGGVLICSQWVLTAASCLQGEDELHQVNKQNVFVVMGERNLLMEDRNQTNYYLEDIRIHPHYDPKKLVKNDLALLKLYLPEGEEPKYRPACLPLTDRMKPMHLQLDIEASIAGWGTTSASSIPLAGVKDLMFEMATTSVSLSSEDECPLRKGLSTHLCAGRGSKTCCGLPGSPLVAEDPSSGFRHVLGILAYRGKCAEGQNQYVELTRYINWINQATADCQMKHWGLFE